MGASPVYRQGDAVVTPVLLAGAGGAGRLGDQRPNVPHPAEIIRKEVNQNLGAAIQLRPSVPGRLRIHPHPVERLARSRCIGVRGPNRRARARDTR